MVIRIVPVALLLLLSCIAVAQPVKWNFRAGWHTSSAQIIDKSSGHKTGTNHLNGLSAGVGLKVEFDNLLYFTPRVQYSMHGFETAGNKETPSVQYRVHYIEFPVLLQLDFNKKQQGFYAQFGPSLGAAIAGSSKEAGKSTPLRFAMTQYNRVNIDAVAHVGYRFKNKLSVDAGYTYGLTSITNGDTQPIIRMAQLGIGLSYQFAGKKNQK